MLQFLISFFFSFFHYSGKGLKKKKKCFYHGSGRKKLKHRWAFPINLKRKYKTFHLIKKIKIKFPFCLLLSKCRQNSFYFYDKLKYFVLKKK
jgi:hypothetical protein